MTTGMANDPAHPEPPNEAPVFAILDDLIDRWCARRDLVPLATLLPSVTSFAGLTDSWMELFHALRSVRARAHGTLPDDEITLLGEAIARTYQSLKAAGVDVGGD
jgi:hypothetical protein